MTTSDAIPNANTVAIKTEYTRNTVNVRLETVLGLLANGTIFIRTY